MKKAILVLIVASVFTACNNTTTTAITTDSTKVDSTVVDSTKILTDSVK
jgi:hypothetical protein